MQRLRIARAFEPPAGLADIGEELERDQARRIFSGEVQEIRLGLHGIELRAS